MQKAVTYPRKKATEPLPSVIEAGYNESDKCFNIMFVRYDDDRSMEVVESSVIDFNKVIENLQQGNSVFISPKRSNNKAKTKTTKQSGEYFSHI